MTEDFRNEGRRVRGREGGRGKEGVKKGGGGGGEGEGGEGDVPRQTMDHLEAWCRRLLLQLLLLFLLSSSSVLYLSWLLQE